MNDNVQVFHADCLPEMQRMAAEGVRVDCVVTDPPYLLNFMGKEFDRQHQDLPGGNAGQKMQAWHYRWAKIAYDLLPPGGYIAAFGGDRTFHRLYSAIEDAGFEPRHTVMWIFGTGFPKSRNVSADLEKMEWCDCED